MTFGAGIVWPGHGLAAADPTTTYVDSVTALEIGEQERFLFCRLNLPIGGTVDPGMRVRVDVSLDYDATLATMAASIAAATWTEYERVDIPHVEVGNHFFEVKLPHHCWVRFSVRDMGGDPDTSITITGLNRSWSVGTGKNGQPLELESVQNEGVLAWHNAGAAEALGNAGLATSVSGGWIPVGEATELEIQAVTTGGPPTSIEIGVQQTYQDIAVPLVFGYLPAINFVTGGDVNHYPAEEQFQSAAGTLANGTYPSRPIAIRPGSMVRLFAERTGAAVNLLARVRLFKV